MNSALSKLHSLLLGEGFNKNPLYFDLSTSLEALTFLPMAQPDEVCSAIKRALPDAQVTVEDLSGGGDHLQVNVVSKSFAGLSLIRQHQMVYEVLKDELASEAIHALALNTSTPH